MEYAIIDNYRDLPLGVYLDILKVQETEPDELRRQCLIIGALAALSEQEVLALPLDEYKRLRARSEFLAVPCPDDLLRVADSYPAGDWILRPVKEYDKLTVAQYVDFQTFCREPQENLPQLLSVLLIPDGHRYNDGYDMAAVQDAIQDWVNVADALALAAHFFASSSASIATTLNFSRALAGRMKDGKTKAELETKIAEVETLLARSGDGSQPSTESPSSAGAPGTTSGR